MRRFVSNSKRLHRRLVAAAATAACGVAIGVVAGESTAAAISPFYSQAGDTRAEKDDPSFAADNAGPDWGRAGDVRTNDDSYVLEEQPNVDL